MKMRRERQRWLGLVVALAGCGSSPTGSGSDDVGVRLLQADPAVQEAVDLAIDGVVVARGVGFGSSSPLVVTSAGRHTFSILAGATQLAQHEDDVFSGQKYYAVSAVGRLYLTRVAGVPDTGQRNSNRAHVRFVNVPGSGDPPPALVDASLYAPATVDSTQHFQLDTRIASYWSLMYLDPGTVTIQFRAVGSSTVLAEVVFPVAMGEVKAVIVERDSAGNLRVRVVTEE